MGLILNLKSFSSIQYLAYFCAKIILVEPYFAHSEEIVYVVCLMAIKLAVIGAP